MEENITQPTLWQMSSQKSEQIAHLIQQCFAIQDTYGKSPEELKILMKAMIEDLKNYRLGEINIAFRKWREDHSKIPTPANILKILKARNAEARIDQKKFSEFDGDWPAYKQYLNDHGLLNQSLKS